MRSTPPSGPQSSETSSSIPIRRIRRPVGPVRGVGGDHSHPGLVPVAIHEVRGFVPQEVGLVALAREGPRLAIRIDIVGVRAVEVAREGKPVVPSGRHVAALVAVYPFAEVARGVTGLPEARPDGVPAQVLLAKRARPSLPVVVGDVVVVRVLAGEDRRPRRAAQGVRQEGPVEGHPPPRPTGSLSFGM